MLARDSVKESTWYKDKLKGDRLLNLGFLILTKAYGNAYLKYTIKFICVCRGLPLEEPNHHPACMSRKCWHHCTVSPGTLFFLKE